MMAILAWPLQFCGRHGQLILISGLICGMALPQLGEIVKTFLPEIVGLLLCLNALKIGWKDTAGSVRNCGATLLIIGLLQVFLPVIVGGVFLWFDLLHSPLTLAALLVVSAPAVTASPSLSEILGFAPAPALRLLIIGTALFPLTILPLLWLLPIFTESLAILTIAGKLCAIIVLAAVLGFALREMRKNAWDTESLNGAVHLLLAVIVIGMLSNFQPTLLHQPLTLVLWLFTAFMVNFGMQAIALGLALRATVPDNAVGTAVYAGNRNVALFVVALPPHIIDPLLLFVACYQLPMYLTPMMMGRLYALAKKERRETPLMR